MAAQNDIHKDSLASEPLGWMTVMSAICLCAHGRPSWNDPRVLTAAAAAGALLSLVWLLVLGDAGAEARAGLIFASLLTAGTAVAIQPKSSPLLAAAAGVGILAYLAMDPWERTSSSWDSARWLVVFLSGVALAAAVLMVLPRVMRRVIVSLLIVFHFVGILSTVFSVHPAPWLAINVYGYVFRNYLEFMYLNNAYHFYSPNPGPPNLLWFRIEYEDGTWRWLKIPNREDYPTSVNYQRRLSLAEYASQGKVADSKSMDRRVERRNSIRLLIPTHPLLPPSDQYKEPNQYSKWMLESYARHVARHYPSEKSSPVARVRIYRVIHIIPDAKSLAYGDHPLDMYFNLPYYVGTFDPQGRLLDPDDPLLYWLVPIIRRDETRGAVINYPQRIVEVVVPEENRSYEVYDFLNYHAQRMRSFR